MALLTIQPLTTGLAGTTITPVAVAASDTVAVNLGYSYVLMVVNGNASPDTVTLSPAGTDEFGRTRATKTVSVTNGTTSYIWLTRQDLLADATTGLITITHSVTATVTCAVIAIPFVR
jgi:hypothetical protein